MGVIAGIPQLVAAEARSRSPHAEAVGAEINRIGSVFDGSGKPLRIAGGGKQLWSVH